VSITANRPQYFFSANTGVSTRLTRRINFTSSATLGYSPYLGLFQGITTPTDIATSNAPGLAAAAAAVANYSGTVMAGINYGLTRRSFLTVDLNYNATIVPDRSESNVDTWQSHAAYNYRVTSKVTAHAGYYRGQTGIAGNRTVLQGGEFGVDYGDALRLQLTRHTVLTFSPSFSAVGSPIDGRLHYSATGSASLQHSFGRTWTSSLTYLRSLGFLPGFQDLVLSDSVTGTVNGQLARRINSYSSAMWSTGQVGFGNTQAASYGALGSFSTSSGLNFALNRRVGAFTQYSYYKSQVPAGISTLPFLSSFGRQSVIFGVQFFANVYNSQRNRQ